MAIKRDLRVAAIYGCSDCDAVRWRGHAEPPLGGHYSRDKNLCRGAWLLLWVCEPPVTAVMTAIMPAVPAQITRGAAVRLKGGGPWMTALDEGTGAMWVNCLWINDHGDLSQASIQADLLVIKEES